MSVLRLGKESSINIEFIQVLTFIASRKNDLKFVHHLVPVGLWKNYLERLWEFLKFLQIFNLTSKQVEIAEYLQAILIEKDFLLARKNRIGQFKPSTTTTCDLEYDIKAESICIAEIKSANVPQHYRYDYFVIMGKVDYGWIHCFLHHQLKIQMSDDDSSFTGWPGVIDYDSCSSLLETTIEGIKECRKSILVLSKDFLKREWCVLKKIITETMKRRSNFLLIVLLEHCYIPSEIDSERLSFFNFTDDKKIPIEVQHLKLALLEH
ncbi:unnamed protein product [Mytilus edulis]|uniref:TIR domain-containing protein n=1 Tax=Mytilus edulis TaxID=6550 RepID=A0A8S3SFU5_MYTED|nr:unnamed protein product [Mytilus edulis]